MIFSLFLVSQRQLKPRTARGRQSALQASSTLACRIHRIRVDEIAVTPLSVNAAATLMEASSKRNDIPSQQLPRRFKRRAPLVHLLQNEALILQQLCVSIDFFKHCYSPSSAFLIVSTMLPPVLLVKLRPLALLSFSRSDSRCPSVALSIVAALWLPGAFCLFCGPPPPPPPPPSYRQGRSATESAP